MDVAAAAPGPSAGDTPEDGFAPGEADTGGDVVEEAPTDGDEADVAADGTPGVVIAEVASAFLADERRRFVCVFCGVGSVISISGGSTGFSDGATAAGSSRAGRAGSGGAIGGGAGWLEIVRFGATVVGVPDSCQIAIPSSAISGTDTIASFASENPRDARRGFWLSQPIFESVGDGELGSRITGTRRTR